MRKNDHDLNVLKWAMHEAVDSAERLVERWVEGVRRGDEHPEVSTIIVRTVLCQLMMRLGRSHKTGRVLEAWWQVQYELHERGLRDAQAQD